MRISKPLNYYLDINKNIDGTYSLYDWGEINKPRIYFTNQYGKKLLQLILKDEAIKSSSINYAQINILPYSTKHYIAFNNDSPVIEKKKIYNDFKITYHGENVDNIAKIHIKTEMKEKLVYKTIIENICCLGENLPRIVPIFSFFPGYLINKKSDEVIKKNAHNYRIETGESIRLDIYFSGKNFNFQSYAKSMYSFQMFFVPEYLIAHYNHPLIPSRIIRPIKGYISSEYGIWIRCSRCSHKGNPYFQFYDNKNYYSNFLNRNMAYQDDKGNLTWTTGLDVENNMKKEGII